MKKRIAAYIVRLLVGKSYHLAKNPAAGIARKKRVKKEPIAEVEKEAV